MLRCLGTDAVQPIHVATDRLSDSAVVGRVRHEIGLVIAVAYRKGGKHGLDAAFAVFM